MSYFLRFISSSIGKKMLAGATGLLLCGFLITHLAGNLLIFKGADAFNRYAGLLEANPFILPAEALLAAFFLLHVALALRAQWENRRARPSRYENKQMEGGRTPGSATMLLSGIVTAAFLVIHVRTFKFGDKSAGLYRLVVSSFGSPYYSFFYVVAMAGLGLHLSHGFQSAFQTFGVNHPKFTPWIKAAGLVFAAAMSLGFASIPVWAYFRLGAN